MGDTYWARPGRWTRAKLRALSVLNGIGIALIVVWIVHWALVSIYLHEARAGARLAVLHFTIVAVAYMGMHEYLSKSILRKERLRKLRSSLPPPTDSSTAAVRRSGRGATKRLTGSRASLVPSDPEAALRDEDTTVTLPHFVALAFTILSIINVIYNIMQLINDVQDFFFPCLPYPASDMWIIIMTLVVDSLLTAHSIPFVVILGHWHILSQRVRDAIYGPSTDDALVDDDDDDLDDEDDDAVLLDDEDEDEDDDDRLGDVADLRSVSLHPVYRNAGNGNTGGMRGSNPLGALRSSKTVVRHRV